MWFDDPKKEYVCEETGDEVALVKDSARRVIGFVKLNFTMPDIPVGRDEVPVEVKVA